MTPATIAALAIAAPAAARGTAAIAQAIADGANPIGTGQALPGLEPGFWLFFDDRPPICLGGVIELMRVLAPGAGVEDVLAALDDRVRTLDQIFDARFI